MTNERIPPLVPEESEQSLASSELSSSPIMEEHTAEVAADDPAPEDNTEVLSRRGFFRAMGVGAAAVAVGALGGAIETPEFVEEKKKMRIVKEFSEHPRTPEMQEALNAKVLHDKEKIEDLLRARAQKELEELHGEGRFLNSTVEDVYQMNVSQMSYFGEPKEIAVNESTLRIVGVYHTGETVCRNEEIMKRAIEEADAVFLEGTPYASGVREMSDVDDFFTEISSQGKKPGYSREELYSSMQESPFDQFFGHAELLAAQLGKPVVTADPHSGGDRIRTLYTQVAQGKYDQLRDIEETADSVLNFGGIAGGGAALAARALLIERDLWRTPAQHEKEWEECTPEEKTERAKKFFKHISEIKTSRRGLLKTGAALFGLNALALPTVHNNNEAKKDLIATYESETRNILMHNLIDYRNAVVAKGIERYVKEHPEKKKILVLYGQAHSAPLAQYLQSPNLRAVKHATYPEFQTVINEQLQEYRYELFDKPDEKGKIGKWHNTLKESLE